jgi:UTP--glucose-1-phosphate uridylyltransferase
MEFLQNELGLPALKLTLRPSPKVRKALIPAAGFGTRLFPASKATKKELFPIMDQDGVVKPAILIIVEEAIEAGIEEIIIIVQADDLPEFQGFFKTPLSIENFNKLPKQFQDYSHKILEIGRRVSFVIQPKQEGFGHAIYCAREAIGDEPFLLLLGDHIYRSNGEKSCSRQLIDAYQQHGMSILGLRRTPEDQIAHFGTVSGVWIQNEELLNVSEFSEKPTVDYARQNLRIPDLAEDEYLTVFGQYILQPELFSYLEEHINNNVRERGEFQLTSALERLRKENGFLGLIVNGKRFDIGIPSAYLDTLVTFPRA